MAEVHPSDPELRFLIPSRAAVFLNSTLTTFMFPALRARYILYNSCNFVLYCFCSTFFRNVCPWTAAVDYIEMSMRQGLGRIPKAAAIFEFVENANMSFEATRDQRVTSSCSRIAKTHANSFEINLGRGQIFKECPKR